MTPSSLRQVTRWTQSRGGGIWKYRARGWRRTISLVLSVHIFNWLQTAQNSPCSVKDLNEQTGVLCHLSQCASLFYDASSYRALCDWLTPCCVGDENEGIVLSSRHLIRPTLDPPWVIHRNWWSTRSTSSTCRGVHPPPFLLLPSPMWRILCRRGFLWTPLSTCPFNTNWTVLLDHCNTFWMSSLLSVFVWYYLHLFFEFA